MPRSPPGKTPEQLSYFVDDVVKRALQGVRNVGQVERIGGVDGREIHVGLDPDRLQAVGLTAVNVSQALRGTNRRPCRRPRRDRQERSIDPYDGGRQYAGRTVRDQIPLSVAAKYAWMI